VIGGIETRADGGLVIGRGDGVAFGAAGGFHGPGVCGLAVDSGQLNDAGDGVAGAGVFGVAGAASTRRGRLGIGRRGGVGRSSIASRVTGWNLSVDSSDSCDSDSMRGLQSEVGWSVVTWLAT
jgi:hypothetical protein